MAHSKYAVRNDLTIQAGSGGDYKNLSLGISDGNLTLFNHDGTPVGGVTNVTIENEMNNLVKVNASFLVSPKFFISEPMCPLPCGVLKDE